MIRDNAYGMVLEDFVRALVLDSPPADTSGRSEYGMGLKTAACWFGARWSVETTALGSDRLYRATIDVPELARSHDNFVRASEERIHPSTHYTLVSIEHLYKPLRGRTLERIRDQLGSMYRQDLRSGEIRILWNGDPVAFEEQPVLKERRPDGTTTTWKKEVSFSVPWEESLLPVSGWIAIRDPGKQRDAGLVLLRRGRVIVGGPGEGYRPAEVFGAPNMFRSQRLFGELNMDQWPVTQAKDGFDWSGGLEDAFVEALGEMCKEYGEYADTYRQPRRAAEVSVGEMERISRPTAAALASPDFGEWLSRQMVAPAQPSPESTPIEVVAPREELRRASAGAVSFNLNVSGREWELSLHWQDELPHSPWMQVEYPSETEIEIFLNTAHPFLAGCVSNPQILEMIERFAVGLALAEKISLLPSSDNRVSPSEFRVRMSKILRYLALTRSAEAYEAAGRR